MSEVFELFQNKPIVLNIEVKGPARADLVSKFDYLKTCQTVIKMMRDFEVENQVIISSFNDQVAEAISEVTLDNNSFSNLNKFIIFSLKNYWGDSCANDYLTTEIVEGVNVIDTLFDKALRDKIRNRSQFIGVWFDASVSQENELMYEQLLAADQNCDILYSDKPVEAMAYRDRVQGATVKVQC